MSGNQSPLALWHVARFHHGGIGAEIDQEAVENPQMRFGEDVITRVTLAMHEGRLDEAFEEGSANYAAYLVLRGRPGDEERLHHPRDDGGPDRAYGEGFRRVKKYVEGRGIPAWLWLSGTIPWEWDLTI
jgi:hypothetical protein